MFESADSRGKPVQELPVLVHYLVTGEGGAGNNRRTEGRKREPVQDVAEAHRGQVFTRHVLSAQKRSPMSGDFEAAHQLGRRAVRRIDVVAQPQVPVHSFREDLVQISKYAR